MKKLYIRIISIIGALAAIDIFSFSEGFMNLKLLGGTSESTLISLGVILLNLLVLFGSYKYYNNYIDEKFSYDTDKLKTYEDFKDALDVCKGKYKEFSVELDRAIVDLVSIEKKQRVLEDILESNDRSNFVALIDLGNESKIYLFNNLKRILNRIAITDTGEGSGSIEEHKKYVNAILENNDKILKEYGKFLTEVSRMDDPSEMVDVTEVLGDMVGTLKNLRGDDENIENKYKN